MKEDLFKSALLKKYLRSSFLAVLLIIFLTQVTGCKYLRWYRLKNQIAELDEYFKFKEKKSPHRFSSIFKSPVLIPEDVLLVTGKKPTRRSAEKPPYYEEFECKRIFPNVLNNLHPMDSEPLLFTMHYNEDERICEYDFPVQISTLLNIESFKMLVNSTLNGDFDRSKQTFKGIVVLNSEEIPDRQRIIDSFGTPDNYSKTDMNYTYRIITETKPEKEEKISLDVIVNFKLAEDGKLEVMHFDFATIHFYVRFEELGKKLINPYDSSRLRSPSKKISRNACSPLAASQRDSKSGL